MMARKSRVTFNKRGFEQLRKQPSVRADLLKRAKAVAAEAGGESIGYKVTNLALEDPRSAVSVMATGHARNHNRKYNSLVKAMDAARD